jgi:murein DD-endopeptidase MepM/ murein hydrolase activator NlpD
MKHRLFKKLKKLSGRHFTLLVIPKSGTANIHNYRIPFIVILFVFIFIPVNIYIFLTYSIQVWQINGFRHQISNQKQKIAKLTAEKSRVMPVLNKNHHLEVELARYRQENQDMLDTWNRVHQKAHLRVNLASRGFFNRDTNGSYTLTPISKANVVTTSLEQLDHNLDQLEHIIGKETEEQKQLFQDLKAYEHRLDHMPSIWPVYAKISSPFGVRFHPIYRRYIGHEGVDLAVLSGSKVRAAADGTVSFAGWEAGYGLLIKINHDYGYETRYGHNSSLLVHAGQTVKKGQVICLSGNTGESTGPHVHYEVRMNGRPVNPVPFLKK